MPSAKAVRPSDEPRAWTSLACHLRLWMVLVAVLTADLVSKHLAFARLGEPGTGGERVVVPGFLRFVTQYNEGAAMGILHGQVPLFVAVGVGALAMFLVLFARSGRRQWFFQIGIALVLAGALGNIYDRVMPHTGHRVRDFIHITTTINADWIGAWPRQGVYPWVFNIADVALVVGVIMIMLSSTRHGRRHATGTSV